MAAWRRSTRRCCPTTSTLLDYIRVERAKGRRIVLATAANEAVAERIAAHLGLFDEVIASTATTTSRAPRRPRRWSPASAPPASFTPGDARADLAGMAPGRGGDPGQCAAAASRRRSGARAPVEHAIDDRPPLAAALLRAMRPHQWVKNLLVFVPIFTATRWGTWQSWAGGVLAFLAFSAVASSIYLVNDLLDLAADRAHPHKRHRPFAAGTAPLPAGIRAFVVLLLAGGVLHGRRHPAIVLSLRGDVPGLFAMAQAPAAGRRLRAGGALHGTADRRRRGDRHSLSLWLLAFASFLFLSLALVKRVAEVMDSAHRSTGAVSGRGYGPGDLMILELFGVCSTFAVEPGPRALCAVRDDRRSVASRPAVGHRAAGLAVELPHVAVHHPWLHASRPDHVRRARLGYLGDRRRHGGWWCSPPAPVCRCHDRPGGGAAMRG